MTKFKPGDRVYFEGGGTWVKGSASIIHGNTGSPMDTVHIFPDHHGSLSDGDPCPDGCFIQRRTGMRWGTGKVSVNKVSPVPGALPYVTKSRGSGLSDPLSLGPQVAVRLRDDNGDEYGWTIGISSGMLGMDEKNDGFIATQVGDGVKDILKTMRAERQAKIKKIYADAKELIRKAEALDKAIKAKPPTMEGMTFDE